MVRALRRFEDQLQQRLHEAGYRDVTVGHTNVLRHLDPDGMRMSALAHDAGITKQAVTQAVRALKARGLVDLVPDPDDARAKRVIYTERGRSLVGDAITHIIELEHAWREVLGDDAYVSLRASLEALGREG